MRTSSATDIRSADNNRSVLDSINLILNAASVITDAEVLCLHLCVCAAYMRTLVAPHPLSQAAVTDCQNPGYECGQEVGDVIRILAGIGARDRRDRALRVAAAVRAARARHMNVLARK